MPSYDLTCAGCGRSWERFSTVAERYAPCDECGGAVVQEFKPAGYRPFLPYFDVALGREVTSFADRWAAMKPVMDGDVEVRGRLEYREKLSKGALSARRDRIEQQRKERG